MIRSFSYWYDDSWGSQFILSEGRVSYRWQLFGLNTNLITVVFDCINFKKKKNRNRGPNWMWNTFCHDSIEYEHSLQIPWFTPCFFRPWAIRHITKDRHRVRSAFHAWIFIITFFTGVLAFYFRWGPFLVAMRGPRANGKKAQRHNGHRSVRPWNNFKAVLKTMIQRKYRQESFWHLLFLELK